MKLALVIAVFACLLVPLTATGPVQATKRCRDVSMSHTPTGFTHAQVIVKKGNVSCLVARRVARHIVAGRARYHDGGSAADSWYVYGDWKGSMSTGAWGATNSRTDVYLTGAVR
jgi:hypothetical protein